MAEEMHELAQGAKEAVAELLDAFFIWIVPLILVVVGFLTAPALGLSGAIGTLIVEIPGLSEQVAATLADLLAAGIWGGIAFGILHAGKSFGKDNWAKFILYPLAGLFGGFSLGELFGATSGKVLNGAIGKAASEVQGAVTAEGGSAIA